MPVRKGKWVTFFVSNDCMSYFENSMFNNDVEVKVYCDGEVIKQLNFLI